MFLDIARDIQSHSIAQHYLGTELDSVTIWSLCTQSIVSINESSITFCISAVDYQARRRLLTFQYNRCFLDRCIISLILGSIINKYCAVIADTTLFGSKTCLIIYHRNNTENCNVIPLFSILCSLNSKEGKLARSDVLYERVCIGKGKIVPSSSRNTPPGSSDIG